MMIRPAHNQLRHNKRIIALVLMLLMQMICVTLSSANQPREYQLKAAFLYSIIKFVDCPGCGVVTRPLNLAILGQDPFGDDLDVIKGKTAKGRIIVVKYYRRAEDVKDCDVLFISASEKNRRAHIIKQFQNMPILTVADQEGFCEAGGMINLTTVNNKVGFEVNVAAVHRAQLSISSQLLKLAKTITE